MHIFKFKSKDILELRLGPLYSVWLYLDPNFATSNLERQRPQIT